MPAEVVWGVVLAAGRGRRFGGHKLLAPFRGEPLGAHAFRTTAGAVATKLLGGAVVVCATGDDQVRSLATALGLSALEHSGTTMASSIQAGLQWLATLPVPPDGAMIVLGDQPLLRPAHFESVLASAAGHPAPICRPRYLADPGSPGHPVLIRRSAWAAVNTIEGDQGLRGAIGPGGIEVHLCDLPGSCPDVDTPDDLMAIESGG